MSLGIFHISNELASNKCPFLIDLSEFWFGSLLVEGCCLLILHFQTVSESFYSFYGYLFVAFDKIAKCINTHTMKPALTSNASMTDTTSANRARISTIPSACLIPWSQKSMPTTGSAVAHLRSSSSWLVGCSLMLLWWRMSCSPPKSSIVPRIPSPIPYQCSIKADTSLSKTTTRNLSFTL